MKIKEWARSLKSYIYALYLATKHKSVSLWVRIFIVVIVAYAVSPIDLIPDFIPVIGYVDDLLLLPLAIWLVIKLIPEDVWLECINESKRNIDSIPAYKVVPILIVVLWCAIILYLITLCAF